MNTQEFTENKPTIASLPIPDLLTLSCWIPVVGVITGGIWLFKQEAPNPDPGPIGIHSIVHGLYGGLILWLLTSL